MDLSVPKLSSCQESSASLGLYQPFATPAPAMSRSYSANTLTPGVIPSPLNFPSLTPPSSPFYSLYSPSPVQRANQMYDPAYLRKLKSNPIFRDLQSVLVQDCTQMQVPANLITTSWNLMQLNQTTTSDKQPSTTSTNTTEEQQPTSNTNCEKVYLRHIKLQDKILKVRIDPAVSADGLKVENDYSEQVGKIEMDRYRALNSCPTQIKTTINDYYDKERLTLADRTEADLDELVKKAEKLRQSVNIMNNLKGDANKDIIKTEPNKQLCEKLSGKVDGASLLLQTDDKMNAVRKLQFNTSDENINNNNDDEDDYLNCSVNSEDFEIDEIDVETVDKDEKPTHVIATDSVSVPKEDLLQKCLTESGISPQPHQPTSPELNISSTSTDNTTSEGRSSPMSLDSVKSTSSPNTENNNSYGTQSTPELSTIQSTPELSTNHIPAVPKFESIPTNHQSPFSLPSMYHPASFLQPDNINMTLSYMQKICSAPAVTFTPESRRDFTPAFTPDFTPKMLPLSELSHNYSTDNFHHRYPTSHCSPYLGLQHPATLPGTINPATWCTESSLQGTSHRPTSQSKKRKSPCDEVEGHTDIVNNNTNHNQNTHIATFLQKPRICSLKQAADTRFSQNSNDIDSNSDNIDGDFELKNPVFRTHRMLTPESTNILSNWYHAHVNYPYPNDEEVEQLATMTNITTRQVKKWMANKRVRCFNTLSITGNQHPIKYKYKGQERRKKQPAPAQTQSDKENNCDSTTSDKKPNYSTLSESAKVILNDWYDQHVTNPYPNEEEKRQLAETCSITISQVKSWFANKRNRTNNTKRQVPNYFLNKHPEYSQLVHLVGQKREESRMIKRRKINEVMYIQPQFYF